jgi:carbon monoxide dehydrogenase subunit G
MTSMKVERDVAASPERVWSIISDLDRSAKVISAIESIERLDGGSGFGVGTKWRETRIMFGREATETMEVSAVDEGRSYTVESPSRGVHYPTIMAVEPAGDGSRLSMTFEGEATSVGGRLMAVFGRLMEGSTRKALAQDLDDIAAAAEKDADETAPGAG